jgi:predicted small lipoprotein YifL
MDCVVRWVTLYLLVSLVASCGQRGPLTLPEEAAVAVTTAIDGAAHGSL